MTAVSSGGGGCGRYSISDCGCSAVTASCQNPCTHWDPPRTGCQCPGTQTRPGGGARQNPLTQMKSDRSSSQSQYPGIHWTFSPAGRCSGGSSSIGSGGWRLT